MTRDDVTKVASAWLSAQDSLWSHHELGHLIKDKPLDAWRVIESMISRTDDEETLQMIGVGPIEDILSGNGPTVIGEIERFVQAEPKLLICLRAAWRSSASDEVWARVRHLIAE